MTCFVKTLATMFVLAGLCSAQNLTYLSPGHVTLVEPTYMPNRVQFQMDTGDSNCPAGSWILWIGPSADNNKAVFAGLLAALLSNRLVVLVYDPVTVHANQSPCTVSYVQIR